MNRATVVDASQLPAGPKEPPLIQMAWWLSRPIGFLESCRKRFGDNFSVTFLGSQRPTVMLSNPEAIRALYTEHGHNLPPGRTLALRPIMGASSVLLLEGREHLTLRKAMLPPFHGARMLSYESIVREVADREIATWPQSEPFALHPRMQAITLEVILSAVFGVTDPERRAQLQARLPLLLSNTSSVGLQLRFMLSRRFSRGDPMARLKEVVRQVDEPLLEEIAGRRSDPDLQEREDILSLLMTAPMEDGNPMSDGELRDQLVTLLLAGHETTATALAWTFDLLLRHPHILTRLTEEIDAGEDDTYLRAVISESLRLRPVVPLAGRRLTCDLDAGDLHLPTGTDVTPAIWLTHTRTQDYPEPYAFRPERFLDDAPSTYSWIPFGGGVRRCLGASFAEFEMRVVLQTILQQRTLTSVGDRAERVARRNVTFSPRNGTVVRSRVRVGRPRAAIAV
jgi:cytochrome P450 family 135